MKCSEREELPCRITSAFGFTKAFSNMGQQLIGDPFGRLEDPMPRNENRLRGSVGGMPLAAADARAARR